MGATARNRRNGCVSSPAWRTDAPRSGLERVDNESPFYHLSGSNNVILITTERYRKYPIQIKGYGAGAEVTARRRLRRYHPHRQYPIDHEVPHHPRRRNGRRTDSTARRPHAAASARKPTIDRIASARRLGHPRHRGPKEFAPGSEIAHLSLLGYDVPPSSKDAVRSNGRMGVEIGRGEMVHTLHPHYGRAGAHPQPFGRPYLHGRCGRTDRPSSNGGLGSDDVRFHTGVSYRHLLTIRGGDKRLHTVGPHDVPDRPFGRSAACRPPTLPPKPTARRARELIFRSQELLADHPVNRARRAAGKTPATSIWRVVAGLPPRMQTLQERYAPIRNGSVISAVDLIRESRLRRLTPVDSRRSDGALRHQLRRQGRGRAAALRDEDFVFLHIEASDEAARRRPELKVRTIEALDHGWCGRSSRRSPHGSVPVSLAILPDHPTPACCAPTPPRRSPSRSGGAAAIPTWWGPTTTECPTGPLRPPAGRCLHRPIHPRYRITDEKYKFPHDEILQHKPPHAQVRSACGRRQHGARQRALHARTDRAVCPTHSSTGSPVWTSTGSPAAWPTPFSRGDRTRNAAAHRPRHVLLRHSGMSGSTTASGRSNSSTARRWPSRT